MYKSATPAYGRDYKSKAAVMEDWNAGKDFVIQPEGQYFNKQNFEEDKNITAVNIRYKKLTAICVVNRAKR